MLFLQNSTDAIKSHFYLLKTLINYENYERPDRAVQPVENFTV